MTDVRGLTLAQMVAANPARARVLDAYGLDYCCHGGRSFDEACRQAGVDRSEIVAELDVLPADGDRTWTTLGASALTDDIVATHHRYLHEELPALDALAVKVLGVHGGRHPELAAVRRLVGQLWSDLEPHMLKEERVLFPAIHALSVGPSDWARGSITSLLRVLRAEHERAGELLAHLRLASNGFGVPPDGCASFRSLYDRLGALEVDTHLHIHKENHVLFPAALRLAGAA